MKKADAIRSILKARPALQAEGVTHVWLFGSVARDKATETSDVDLYFEHNVGEFGLIEYASMKQAAEDALPFQVDFIARSALHPELRSRIEAQAEQVF